MKLYGIKACDTCRKALKMLEASGHDVVFIDIRDTPLEASKLAEFHETIGDQLLNTRSTTWRGLSEAERAGNLVDLITAHPTLMKRPVIEADQLYLGWKKDVQDALL
ncbi:MAG: ArsC/Spx/MgsR family protein [Pseudomonadota bacterium]